jgi:AcrR family transcriptional regulator
VYVLQVRNHRSNRQRSETTRAELIGAARKLFVANGFSETGTPEIVAAAGLTRGALYHHFPGGKEELFRAVVEAEAATVAAEIERVTPQTLEPLDAMGAGGDAYLAAMAESGRTRMMLLDGPAVLGRAVMDEIDARHGGRTLREGLALAMGAGAIRPLPLDALVHLLSSAFERAALEIEAGGSVTDYRRVIAALIDGMAE